MAVTYNNAGQLGSAHHFRVPRNAPKSGASDVLREESVVAIDATLIEPVDANPHAAFESVRPQTGRV